jgi:hypothetical protein
VPPPPPSPAPVATPAPADTPAPQPAPPAKPPPLTPAIAAAPPPEAAADSPESEPDVQAEEREVVAPRKAKAKMFSLTLLDGTTISLPSPRKKRSSSAPEAEAPEEQRVQLRPGEEFSDQLTARDLVSALRAVAHGVDASEILGTEPRWEAMFSALLSILLRKGLIADWEFVEEFRKV